MTTAVEIGTLIVGETRNAAVSFADLLDSGESLSGTPVVAEVSTSDLTISNAAVSSTSLTIQGESVAAGLAVTFRVTGGTAGQTYTIKITANTDASLSQTVIGYVTLQVM